MKTTRSSTVGLFLCLSTTVALPATYTDTFVPGLNMIANHLNTAGNTLDDIFGTAMPDGTTVFFWDQGIQNWGPIATYFAGIGWDPNPPLNPGSGAFLQNPTATPISYTYSGAAPVNAPVALPLNQFVILSHKSASALPASFMDIVGSPPAPGFCTRLYRWNRPLQQYDVYVSSGGPWIPSAPSIPQGESVFIIQASGDNTPPTLVNATISFGTSTILLEFSEPVHPTSAQTIGNYTLTGGPGTLVSAVMFPITTPPLVETKFVRLSATGLNTNFVYKLNISGLTDLCGNLIDPCTFKGLNCFPPANNLCASATPAVVGANPGTVVCATTDGYSAWDVICPGPDVWYAYTPPCNGQLSLSTCGSPLNTVVSVWDGCPVNLGTTELWGDNDSCGINETFTLPFDVLSCQTYYIRVSGANGAFGTFTLNVAFTPGPPANDACASATVIGNGVFPFDNCMATPASGSPMKADVWFVYTPTCAGPVHISTCGSTINTVLAVHSGSCAGPQIALNDDAVAGPCPASLQSYVTFTAVASTPYYIRVGSSPSASTGCGKLTVVGPTPISGTCPPGMISQGGTGGNVVYTRMFQVTGTSSGTPWAWCISAPCCYSLQQSSVTGVLPVGAPPSALVAAFVASINSQCPQALPWRLTATQVLGLPNCMTIAAYGCYSDIIFSVGPAGTPCENQCVVPNPFDYLPTAGPCSFNPPLKEIPLSNQDCNRNGVDDLLDILEGRSVDANNNRVPDECETCERPRFVSIPLRQQVKPGQRAVFNAQVKGGQNLSYQWTLNSAVLPGATEDKLIIDPVRLTDAGEYQVMVDYGCGQLRSAPVPLLIAGDRLQVTFRNGQVVVTWDAPNASLQSTEKVGGDWKTVDNAVSPHVIPPPFTQQFFRLMER